MDFYYRLLIGLAWESAHQTSINVSFYERQYWQSIDAWYITNNQMQMWTSDETTIMLAYNFRELKEYTFVEFE